MACHATGQGMGCSGGKRTLDPEPSPHPFQRRRSMHVLYISISFCCAPQKFRRVRGGHGATAMPDVVLWVFAYPIYAISFMSGGVY